ncbi:SDR family NAD(P)-dependent oxidoreductase [Streptomonospora nanhaiensis]|uniref:SDR family NAD(P)-dependent oxidoreductase n=1 Tax=Streptomonospora nanhaiensis TaxID=1323731 RepID=UPI001C38110C|nr:SDR family NAD(P)-dependent oxidoreductase [Streptomonospora nanhaiensis]MBV2363436.1 SDR family NAD(P)-dependent oxidoreductase [Streptomonospora nanhaiensis]MBX9387670.1 SDR family NAD(P)-dependent oxidoreductase [Streptomonospora nanhaiensis]
MGLLDGRIALITGAGRGIGREHALAFARAGAAVVVNDTGTEPDGTGRDTGVAASVAAEITAQGGRAVASTDSVADPDGARRIVDTAVSAFGDLHVVVNNAAILRNAPLLEMSDDDFSAVLDVHLAGTFHVTRAAGRYWRDRAAAGAAQDRSVINTSSGSGLFTPLPTQANYAAAKAGIAALTSVAALELRRHGVRVNCYAPSAHRTRLTQGVPGMDRPRGAGGRDPYDPAASSPLLVWLAAADCPLTGQVLRVRDRSIGVAATWRVQDEVAREEPWTPEDLGAALARLDLPDPEADLMRALGTLDDSDAARAAFRARLDGTAG